MRKLIFAAMLGASSIAMAQNTSDPQDTTTQQTQTTEEEAMDATQTDTTTDTTTQNQPGTQTTTPTRTQTSPPDTATPTSGTMSTSGSMSAGSGMAVAPGNQAPERDARGIPVVSDPATAPAGTNQMTPVPPGAQVQLGGSGAFATQAGSDTYPACSKTVTDNCVQSYERGARPR
ncbi:hypothetical protein SH591_03970 [Sphingomonas sp. LY54]|uniref:hypothetical protein n=1 Tax=Sphingomonas sp. LY54 TaxID=3095343 RepID=UPI002D792601|nr:hypothetical protein [Sphingomonas sp. LY54]WRP29348.1 hypothetical protein SH591_03970 [Sphingomonas sp. LY54]